MPSPFMSPTRSESPKRACHQQRGQEGKYFWFFATRKDLCDLVIVFGIFEEGFEGELDLEFVSWLGEVFGDVE